MTRRERLENKLERREEWAEKARTRSDAAMKAADAINANIPFGQPILIGHHSEKRARRDQERIFNNVGKSVAEHKLAEYHKEKAAGLSDMLDNTIFSDDIDAVEQIEKKIAGLEAAQEQMKEINIVCRDKKLSKEEKLNRLLRLNVPAYSGAGVAVTLEMGGIPSYKLTNNNANIRRYKQRLAEIKARQARQAAVENAANGVVIEDNGYGYINITFADKPDYSVISALKKAGFYWIGGHWNGKQENMPEEVEEMLK